MTPAGSSSRAPRTCPPGSCLRISFTSPKPSTVNDPRDRHQPLTRISNIPLQAYCHAIVTNNDLWIAAAGWGIVIFLLGIVFFWQAEALYGRG